MPYDEIVGMGWDDIVGADYHAVGAAASAEDRLAQAFKRAGGQHIIRNVPYTKAEKLFLGFDSGAALVAAGAAATINQQPQTPFRPTRFATAASTAASFVITQLLIGTQNMLAATGNVPAETFSQTAQGVEVVWGTAQVSMIISIGVTNISLAPARFLANLIGDTVR